MMNFKSRLVSHAVLAMGLFGVTGSALAQNWTNQSNMQVARVEATTIDYRDNIYVFNGFQPGIRIANSIEKYDVATSQWSIIGSTTTMNDTAVTHNGAVRVGAEVWIIGGRVGSHPGRVTDRVWIYNLDNGKWRRGPDLPVPGAAGGAALVNNKVHWIGGLDADARCDVDRHLVYDLGKPSAGWKDITSSARMPTPRNHFSTAVVDDIIYVMGGQFGHDNCPGKFTQDSPLVHAFNPRTNEWSQKANMPNKNSHSEPGTFVYKGDIYTTGGENAGDKVWRYQPKSNKWSTFRTLPETLVAPIARIVDGKLIVAGGGAPRAALATDKVRSMVVDNNPPALQPVPAPQPEPVQQPAPPPAPEPGSHTPAGATLISMEAEYFDVISTTSTHQWVHVARGNSSNDDAMITTPDQGDLASTTDNTPMLSYMVNFNHTGKHYIWVRGAGDTNDSGVGNSDSVHVGLNGTVASTAHRIDQFPAEWTWSRHTPTNAVATLNVVTAGVNIVNFWMREDGLAIDKFVITSDPDFVPTGNGPDVTDGSEGFVPPVSNNEIDNNTNTATVDPIATAADNDTPDLTDTANDVTVEEADTDVAVSVDTVVTDVMANTSPDTVSNTSVETALNDEVSDTAVMDVAVNELPAQESAVAKDPADTVGVTTISSDGVFGGSASSFGLLLLFGMCFLRSVRRSYG